MPQRVNHATGGPRDEHIEDLVAEAHQADAFGTHSVLMLLQELRRIYDYVEAGMRQQFINWSRYIGAGVVVVKGSAKGCIGEIMAYVPTKEPHTTGRRTVWKDINCIKDDYLGIELDRRQGLNDGTSREHHIRGNIIFDAWGIFDAGVDTVNIILQSCCRISWDNWTLVYGVCVGIFVKPVAGI